MMPYPINERSSERREALLCLLYLMGDEHYALPSIQTYAPLAHFFELTHDEQYRKLDDGTNRNVWDILVQTSREDLAKRGFIHRGNRAIWQLTEAGVRQGALLLSRYPHRYSRLRQMIAVSSGSIKDTTESFHLPEEATEGKPLIEGAVRSVVINTYERDPEARRKCIEYYGAQCSVCAIDFGATYGEVAQGLIHVHHLRPLSSIGEAYQVDPINDLRPVCPNCHAVIHRARPPYTIEEVQMFLNQSGRSID